MIAFRRAVPSARAQLLKAPFRPAGSCQFHAGHFQQDERKNANAVAAPVPAAAPVEKSSWLSALSDTNIALPIAGFIAFPAIATGNYILSAETQLSLCFFLFCTSIHKFGGEMISSYFDARADAILKEHNEAENKNISLAKDVLRVHENQLGIFDDVAALTEAQKGVVENMCSLQANKIRHEIREAVIQNLNSLVVLENNYKAKLHERMVTYSHTKVKEAVESGGKAFKEDAFNNALAALSGEAKAAKAGEDAVVGLYNKYIQEYRQSLEKKEGQMMKLADEEVKQLQSDLTTYARRNRLDEADFKAEKQVKFKILL